MKIITQLLKMGRRALLNYGVNISHHTFFGVAINNLVEIAPTVSIGYKLGTYTDIEKMDFQRYDYSAEAKHYALARLNAGDVIVLGGYEGRIVFYIWICFGQVELGYNKFIRGKNDVACVYKAYVIREFRGRRIYPGSYAFIKNLLLQKGIRKLAVQINVDNSSSQKSTLLGGFTYLDTFHKIRVFGLTCYLVGKEIKNYILN